MRKIDCIRSFAKARRAFIRSLEAEGFTCSNSISDPFNISVYVGHEPHLTLIAKFKFSKVEYFDSNIINYEED